MNPHPELTFRIETLAAAQNRRTDELLRAVHERVGARPTLASRLAAGWRRVRGAASAPETAPRETSAAVPCTGARAHA